MIGDVKMMMQRRKVQMETSTYQVSKLNS